MKYIYKFCYYLINITLRFIFFLLTSEIITISFLRLLFFSFKREWRTGANLEIFRIIYLNAGTIDLRDFHILQAAEAYAKGYNSMELRNWVNNSNDLYFSLETFQS